MKYLQETHQISTGRTSNICRTPINYLQDNDHISPGIPSNIFWTPMKYVYYT